MKRKDIRRVYTDHTAELNDSTCKHTEVESWEHVERYLTYDGIEEYVAGGKLCKECGLVLESYYEEDIAAKTIEDKLLKWLN